MVRWAMRIATAATVASAQARPAHSTRSPTAPRIRCHHGGAATTVSGTRTTVGRAVDRRVVGIGSSVARSCMFSSVAGSGPPGNNIGTSASDDTTTTARPIHKVMDIPNPSLSTPGDLAAEHADPRNGEVGDADGAAALVESGDPTDQEPTRRGRRWWPWVMLVVVTALVAVCLFVPTPYYLFEPGSVRPTEPRIEIRNHRSFTTRGSVDFTTVAIQHATVADLVRGWLDDAIEIRSEHEVYPQGEEHDDIVNQKLMDDSKLAAILVAFRTVGYPATLTGTGAFIDEVMKDFPHAKANLRQGDVIVEADGTPVALASDLGPITRDKPIGTVVNLRVRDGRTKKVRDVSMELGRNSDDPSHGYLGVVVSTADQGVDLPFHVEIDSGKVTGPSAGLAWTLGLIDRLTPGSLTKGRKIAVTGEIAPDGRVGAIGGIEQKIATVKRAGVKVFLYPADTPAKEVRAVRKIAGNDVTIHPVATIDEAIAYLLPDGLPSAPKLAS